MDDEVNHEGGVEVVSLDDNDKKEDEDHAEDETIPGSEEKTTEEDENGDENGDVLEGKDIDNQDDHNNDETNDKDDDRENEQIGVLEVVRIEDDKMADAENGEQETEPDVDETIVNGDNDAPEVNDETEEKEENGNNEEADNSDAQNEEADNSVAQNEDMKNHNGKEELTETDKERCRHVFDRKAVEGRLDLKGFKLVFRLLGEVVCSEDAEQMFEDGDKNDDNTIDFEEFCRLYAKFSQEEQERRAAMLTSIDRLFPGSNGESLELKKVEQLLMKLQQPDLDMRLVRERSDLCVEDIKYLVRSMDAHGNGVISKQDFVNTLCQHIDV
uniref:EF-hand domain-containing protein n=1 Tax=Arion vulgaris TaxID=1028688 RepID=A0A0B6ZXX5_9EUPU